MDREHLRDLLDRHPLPPNHALSSLPPLPQTPHHARHFFDSDTEEELQDVVDQPDSARKRQGIRDHAMTIGRLRAAETAKLSDIGVITPARLPRSSTLPSLDTGRDLRVMRQPAESAYPTLSTRQSSVNIARTSPTKSDFLSPVRQSSALLHPSSAAKPPVSSRPNRRNVSGSFMLPAGAEVSMLQDVTFGDLGRVSLGNDSVDMDIALFRDTGAAGYMTQKDIRPVQSSAETESKGSSPAKQDYTTNQPRSPTKRSGRPHMQDYFPTNSPSVRPIGDTVRLPSTTQDNTPPWTSLNTVSTWQSSPTKAAESPHRRSASIKCSHHVPSSSHFLAPPNVDHGGDVSTLLPVSPLKSRHLLADEYLLTRTDLNDESMLNVSLFMPAPTTPGRRHRTEKERQLPNTNLRTSPVRSPMKSARSNRKPDRMDLGDMTMDIQQMMAQARVNKPGMKLGAEESFVDLLRADLGDEDMNTSLSDDSFLPPSLRPGLARSKSLSRLELAKRVEEMDLKVEKTEIKTSETAVASSRPRPPSSFIAPQPVAGASPAKIRNAIPPTGITSKRISLSAGARPLPTSRSVMQIDAIPSRMPSPVKAEHCGVMPILGAGTAPTRTIAQPVVTQRTTKVTTKGSMPPKTLPSSRTAQVPKSRIGSTSSVPSSGTVVPRTSNIGRLPTARSSSKPAIAGPISSRPTTWTQPVPNPTTASRHGVAPIQRSNGSAIPRSFGADATGTSNRLPRTVPSGTTKPNKGSMGPPTMPAGRATASSATTAKSRTLSTPASTAMRSSRPSAAPPISRLSAAPVPSTRTNPPPTPRLGPSTTSRVSAQNATASSRLPAAPSHSSTYRAGTISMSSSSATAAAGLADIRARLDRLQARHQTSRTARQ